MEQELTWDNVVKISNGLTWADACNLAVETVRRVVRDAELPSDARRLKLKKAAFAQHGNFIVCHCWLRDGKSKKVVKEGLGAAKRLPADQWQLGTGMRIALSRAVRNALKGGPVIME